MPSKTRNKKGKTARSRQAPAVDFTEEEVESWFDEEESDPPSVPQAFIAADDLGDKYAKGQLRVVRETKDFTLDYLQHALKSPSYIVNVAPEYQRRQRWNNKKRSLLMESFLMNIPIPPVFLFEREYNAYEVVDGRQRLDTIKEFFDNGFALTGLTYWRELNGKRFRKLAPVIQRGLIRRSIGAIVLLAETRKPEEDDFDVRTVLFDRLNTGGEKLNPQELRNALYPGSFNKLLLSLAREKAFTSAWGIPGQTSDEAETVPDRLAKNTLYRTMADCELVLRFFAIREALTEGRRGSLRRLLDSSMRRHKDEPPEVIEELRMQFLEPLRALTKVFADKAFRLPHSPRPSRPLYDALMVAMSIEGESRKLLAKKRIEAGLRAALGRKATYDVLVGRGNTIEAIRQRVALASTILFGS